MSESSKSSCWGRHLETNLDMGNRECVLTLFSSSFNESGKCATMWSDILTPKRRWSLPVKQQPPLHLEEMVCSEFRSEVKKSKLKLQNPESASHLNTIINYNNLSTHLVQTNWTPVSTQNLSIIYNMFWIWCILPVCKHVCIWVFL